MDPFDNENIELIDKYLTETLSKEEEELFQEKLKEPAFQTQLEEAEQIKASIAIFELRQKKKLLEAEESILKEENAKEVVAVKQTFTIKRFLKIASILVGVSLLAWWGLSQFNGKADSEVLFAQYFLPQKNNLSPVQKGASDQSLLQQTFFYYENAAYDKAIEGFQLLIAEENNDDYRFYQANALLATDQTNKAISLLELIIQKSESQYLKDGDPQWYLALAYIRKKQNSDARSILSSFSTDSFYYEKAKALLKALD